MKRLLIFSLLLLFSSLWAQTWYLSNSQGMKIRSIEEPYHEGWELNVVDSEEGETRYLYEDDVLKKTWDFEELQDGSLRETLKQGNQLISMLLWDSKGELLEEKLYTNEGIFALHRISTYLEKGLIIRNWYDESEHLLFEERIRLRENGTLLSIRRDGFHQNWTNRNNQGDAVDWRNREKGGEVTFYNHSGLPEKILHYSEDTLVKQEVRSYSGSGLLEKVIVTFPQLDSMLISYYDMDENLENEEHYNDGLLVSRTAFRYTDGNLVEKTVLGKGPQEQWLYGYAEEDLLWEEYYLGDQLISRIDHQEGSIE